MSLGRVLRISQLVGGWATPLKNMSSSIGMISNPIYGKIKNVPNHQPVNICRELVWYKNDENRHRSTKKTTLSTSVYQYRLGFWQINYRLINLQVYHQCLGWSRCSRWSLLPGPSLHSVRKGISKSPWLSIVEWSDDTWFIMIWGTPLTSETSILTPYVMFLENAGEVEGIKQDLEQIESGAEPLHTPDRNDLRDSLHKNNPTTRHFPTPVGFRKVFNLSTGVSWNGGTPKSSISMGFPLKSSSEQAGYLHLWKPSAVAVVAMTRLQPSGCMHLDLSHSPWSSGWPANSRLAACYGFVPWWWWCWLLWSFAKKYEQHV